MKKKYTTGNVAACCLLPCGVLTLFMAIIVGYYVIPYKIWEGVMKESTLIQSDNPRYNAWEKVPIKLYQHIYLFNVTNPKNVAEGGEKPILEQLGPYVYEMKMEKFDIVFNENNGTFFYREKIDYFFRGDLSNGRSESDPITFVNIPFVALAEEASRLNSIARYILLEVMKEYPKEQLYLRTTVGRLLFQGIFLPFMKELSDLKGETVLPNNTFGLMYGQNGSDQGLLEIYSGQKHPNRFGDIVSWNGHTEFEWWKQDQFCKLFNGSDGIFQPYATKDKIYYMFMPGMCRSFAFSFERDGEQVFGIPAYKYSVSKTFLANPKDNPDNSCYFDEDSQPYPESGVFPMRGCGKGPMMVSQPHFYQASSVYLKQSVGLSPDKNKHEMTMLMEPYTGTPMSVKVRFQMNVDLNPNKYFKTLRKIPKMVHPLFWMDQTSGIPEKDADTIRNSLVVALKIISVVTQSTLVIAVLLIFISVLLFWISHNNKQFHDDSVICHEDKVKKKGLTGLLFRLTSSLYNCGSDKKKRKNEKSSSPTSTEYFQTKESLLPPSSDLILSTVNEVEEETSETSLPMLEKTIPITTKS